MSLKSVELVRKIRDENYQNCRDMTAQEKIEYTKRLATKFSLYQANKLPNDNSASVFQGLTSRSS
ncbi:MAG: hypothetical protein HW390_210 [Candidatus Brocadiaceae bacterium]|nr:hypothetical protein [Candidatus Brocadiaceae bacterium]